MNKISEIQIVPVKPQNGLVAFASFVYDSSFYLGSVGIYTRQKAGYRLTYPTRNGAGGSFHVFHPINQEIGKVVEKAIIAKFEDVMKTYDRHNNFDTK